MVPEEAGIVRVKGNNSETYKIELSKDFRASWEERLAGFILRED